MTRQIRIKQKHKKSIFEEGITALLTFKIENFIFNYVNLLKILLLKNQK